MTRAALYLAAHSGSGQVLEFEGVSIRRPGPGWAAMPPFGTHTTFAEDLEVKRLSALVLTTLLAVGCGSDSPTGLGNGGPANGSLTFNVDGSAWSATIITPAITSLASGVSAIGAGNTQNTIAFAWLDQGVGTYMIGSGSAMNASLTSIGGSQSWVANSQAGSGTMVVTQRTDSRIVGTFQFQLAAGQGSGATGTRTITNGAFDITF